MQYFVFGPSIPSTWSRSVKLEDNTLSHRSHLISCLSPSFRSSGTSYIGIRLAFGVRVQNLKIALMVDTFPTLLALEFDGFGMFICPMSAKRFPA